MKLYINGKNLELTPTIKEYLENKFSNLNKHDFKITNATIVLHIEKNFHIAEATLQGNNKSLHASAQSENMYQSIDLLFNKLLTQLKKQKEKKQY